MLNYITSGMRNILINNVVLSLFIFLIFKTHFLLDPPNPIVQINSWRLILLHNIC